MSAKPRKEDQDTEEARRIMERLVKTPPKPHEESKKKPTEKRKPAK
ncbi:hypothetical protein A7A08_02150 [Methyloligella halotolerans]|uniref:Uncharacterized protein n=1 Tax=Methyloligella halotolerans TaxID=1177755 RepID=A0A1E2RXB3_9HYPH|nr:hypothetical protein [Methyloligella halotolerans]ODA66853.1 hypothetical protein A7A08_02150 [Methyloligella halotolerans]